MSIHLTIPAALFLTLLFAGMATGNLILFLLSALVFLTVAMGLAGVLWASSTMRISAEASEERVRRGDSFSLLLKVSHRGWIPIAPVQLKLFIPSSEETRTIRLKNMPGRIQTLKLPLYAAHVGCFSAGIQSCAVEDLLGVFRKTIHSSDMAYSMTVLPLTFDTDPLVMAPGDPGSEIMSRATEDLSAPSDTREYQPGDAIKKIHWKLSLRKGELLVRKFEEPVLQEVLILMDCSNPPELGHSEAEADLKDALVETAASLYSDLMKTDHTVRMPLSGKNPVDLDERMGTDIAFDLLARLDFSATDRFERILMMESRRIGKVGCIAVITARLNWSMVEMMIRIHRMGPNLRLYLVTFVPDDPVVLPLISRLQQAGAEVVYVKPDPGGGTE